MHKISRHELFIKSNLLSLQQLNEVEVLARALKKSFSKTALNYAFIARLDFKHQIEALQIKLYKFNFQNLKPLFPDFDKAFIDFLIDYNLFPIQNEDGSIDVVTADPSDFVSINLFIDSYGYKVNKIHIAEDLEIVKAIHITYGDAYLHKAVFNLFEKDPDSCAVETFTLKQLLIVGLFGVILLLLLFLFPLETIRGFNLLLNFFLLIAIAFKFLLTVIGAKSETLQKISKVETQSINDTDLPVYTIQLPVYKESEVIYKLAYNLQSLNYPKHKLDVKLLIESDDQVTFDAIKNMRFPCIFDPVIIPPGQPKTKPKACNYGLYFSKGKYLTIYDAEDIPDSDQLKMVYSLFNKLPNHYIVVQCALNYFNKTENFLTRMFTLEYSYWFDYMLPGLDGLKIPIPLGGTSNHFKFDKLMELGGWDSFNVTEDADLGLRAYAKGYKVTVLNSTTFEEANNDFYNWIRQRSRWIKGYMQTYLVHMRHPISLIKKVGFRGFLGFQFFIGGTFFTFLTYPILLIFFLFYILINTSLGAFIFGNDINFILLDFFKIIFPDWVVIISLFNFLAGNLLMIYVNMIAVFRRRSYNLILYALANPVYWIMHSISAYKGLFQLVYRPFYWEKTNHGLTKSRQTES
jgi:cellulose synthase/poly-beta-1,6-N-acetylglucosamine synthase-like glycosyltransferase